MLVVELDWTNLCATEQETELQRFLADDLPYVNLWYLDNVAVHSARVTNVQVNPSGNYEFLRQVELR